MLFFLGELDLGKPRVTEVSQHRTWYQSRVPLQPGAVKVEVLFLFSTFK